MATMETLVNTVIGASLCGLQQKTLNHVHFPKISNERQGRGNLKRDFWIQENHTEMKAF